MSKVVSPINLKMNIIAGESEKVQIDLYGEDGRLLTRNLKTCADFGKRGVATNQRFHLKFGPLPKWVALTISTLDKAGRIQSLNSVHVLLLSSGANEIIRRAIRLSLLAWSALL